MHALFIWKLIIVYELTEGRLNLLAVPSIHW